ncbi:MAG: TolC family protein [Gammaproteobacteria bacterium]|nr:TolC family protein [Gammaproteobacteria bacterium]
MNTSDLSGRARAMRGFAWLLLSIAGVARADVAEPAYATHGDAALAALIKESLRKNPGLRRARLDFEAERYRIAQVTARPDPKLGITWHGRKPETRTGPQTGTLSVSQEFPWPGKLADRGRIAAAVAEARHEAARAGEARVVLRVKASYYDLGYLDRAIAVVDEEEQLLRHYESLAQARYAQGLGPQQAAVRLQAEITRVLNRRYELVRRRLEVIATLNALRDSPAGAPVTVSPVPEPPEVRIDGVRLQSIGRNLRPEVRAARLLVESDRDRVRLAERRYWPDIVLGASWGRVAGRRDMAGRSAPPPDNGKDVYSLNVGVNIPIYRARYDAAVDEANARLEGARANHRDAVIEVDLAVRAAELRLAMVDEQMALFETALVPQAEQALSLAETAYSTGTAAIVDLLDSEQVLFEVRLGLARLRSDYMKALAEMEWAIGSPFPEEPS